MDWDAYEHRDARELRRRSARVEPPDPGAAYAGAVLRGLYLRRRHNGRYALLDGVVGGRSCFVIPEHVANELSLPLAEVRRALVRLARDGYVSGPEPLPKLEEDGSPIRYLDAEWGGNGWVTSADRFWTRVSVRRKNGDIWRNPPKRLVQRALKKAQRARKPVEFGGIGFRVLYGAAPYVEYGRKNGLLEEQEPELLPRERVEVCGRCGSAVDYRVRHGKRRRDHGLRNCNAELVRRIMEE